MVLLVTLPACLSISHYEVVMSEGFVSPLTIIVFVLMGAWPVILLYVLFRILLPAPIRNLLYNLAMIGVIALFIEVLI